MARRVTPAQYKQMIDKYNREVKRNNQQVQRDIDSYNRDAKRHNAQVQRDIDKYNREEKKRVGDYNRYVKQQNRELDKAVNTYNQQVRQYNNAQRNKRNQLNTSIQKFNQSRFITSPQNVSTTLRYTTETLEKSYQDLSNYTETNLLDNSSSILLDHPIQETENSLQLYNSLSGVDQGEYIPPTELQRSPVEDSLYSLSDELGKRWAGALYSLNPQNPDAARHFCTSVREIFIKLIDLKAPDNNVLTAIPNCELHNGRPNRRSKIHYLLKIQSLELNQLENFIDADVSDLLAFFKTLNDGTHGGAGKFNVQQLLKIKKRAEDSIIFISAL